MKNNKKRHFIAQIIVTNKLLHGCEIYGYEITYKIYEITVKINIFLVIDNILCISY